MVRDTVPENRTERLDELLVDRSLAAVWFGRPNGFAWLTGGDNVVDRATGVGVAAAGYDGSTVRVVTDSIEAERLRTEELPTDVEVETFDWYATELGPAVAKRSPEPAAADFPIDGFESIDGSSLRQPLTTDDVERYRQLGMETTRAVEAVCREAGRGDTERELSARLRGELAGRGIEAYVSLVGGSERAQQYRHYTPQFVELGAYALVSVTAERDGLFTSVTRTIAFDPPPWLTRRHHDAARVEATALAATRAVGRRGGTAGEVFDSIRDAYAALGWDGEWQYHHQGGAAGFAGREWIATPDRTDRVELPMAYAWNPTIQGAKSEGTVLVTEDGYEPLTSGDWPTLTVEAIGHDLTIERPAVETL